MAVFRDGVKIGKFDIRTGLSKKRVQDLAKKHGLIDDPNKSPSLKAFGELDAIRAVMARQEGFMRPNSFHVVFNPPRGIPRSGIQIGGIEHKLRILNKSAPGQISQGFNSANAPAGGFKGADEMGISKLNIMCSKVTMPEKTFDIGLYRHYGPSFAYPKGIQFGSLTTTFYADGVMEIKNFFDQWQTLIYNTLSGNFNYYNEYTSSFDIFSTTTVGNSVETTKGKKKDPENTAQKISGAIQSASEAVDKFFGSNDSRLKKDRFNITSSEVDNYGCRIFDCWPSTVGQIELDHSATDSIGQFDVTWAYSKWVPFGFSGISPRKGINLSIGEFRMEKDGIPFIEDLPPELAGPLSGAIDQGISTAPIGGITKGKIFF